MLEECVLTVLELNCNQRMGHKKTKLNRSFHVIERTRTSSKCQKMEKTLAKRAKILFFIVKYANLWGFCCRRRRGCLRFLSFTSFIHECIQRHSVFHRVILLNRYLQIRVRFDIKFPFHNIYRNISSKIYK